MWWKFSFLIFIVPLFNSSVYAQELKATDIQFAKGAVFVGSSFMRPAKQPAVGQFKNSSFGFNNLTKVSAGYFLTQKLAIVPEVGLQTFNRPKADEITQIVLPDNLLTFGANVRYFFYVDRVCGAFGVQVGYNSGKYLTGSAPLAQQINTELVIARPLPLKFSGKKLQLEGGLGFVSGDYAQKNSALYFSGRVGLNYYLNTKKIIARESGLQ